MFLGHSQRGYIYMDFVNHATTHGYLFNSMARTLRPNHVVTHG